MNRLQHLLKNKYACWLLLLLGYAMLISWPLFSGRFLLGHDAYFHLARIEGIKEGLLAGQFPVRIHAFQLNGYGFPAGIFYPDAFLYFPALLRLAGVSLVTAMNSFCLLLNLITALTAWLAFTKLSRSSSIGAIAALLYTGFLYRLANFYSRCALGEMTAMAFLPLALVSTWLVLRRSPRWWSIVVLAYTAILQSHIISSILLLGAAAVLTCLSWSSLRQKPVRQAILKAVLFTLLLNSWFYVSFLIFYHSMPLHIQALTTYPLSPFTLTTTTFLQQAEAFCGWLLLLPILAFLIQEKQHHRLAASPIQKRRFYSMLSIGILFTLTTAEFFPWDILQKIPVLGLHLSFMQFSFRLEEFASIGLCLSAAISLYHLMPQSKSASLGILIVFLLITAGWNFHLLKDMQITMPYEHTTNSWAIKYDQFSDNESRQQLLNGKNGLYLDYLYADVGFKDNLDAKKKLPAQMPPSKAVIQNFKKQGTTLCFDYSSNIPVAIEVPLFYYPGYQAKNSQGETLPLASISQHRLQVQVPAGQSTITITYTGLPIFRIFDALSAIGWLFFLLLLWRQRRFQQHITTSSAQK